MVYEGANILRETLVKQSVLKIDAQLKKKTPSV